MLELLFLLYAVFSGLKDAVLWSRKGDEAFEWNEHSIFVLERLAVGLLPFAAVFHVLIIGGGWLELGLDVLTGALLFVPWHNVSYYFGQYWIRLGLPFRDSWSRYLADEVRGLTYTSKKSTSVFTASFRIRVVLIILATLSGTVRIYLAF
jgi:hypothetical protein